MNPFRTPASHKYPLVLLALFVSTMAAAGSANPLLSILEQSRDDKRGVTLVVDGRDVSLLVTEIGKDFVVGKSQQHERIVVRIDQIDAALR